MRHRTASQRTGPCWNTHCALVRSLTVLRLRRHIPPRGSELHRRLSLSPAFACPFRASTTLSALPVSEFEAACADCPELSALRSQINKGWPPSVKAVSSELTPYYRLRNELSVKDTLVFRGSRLVAPISLRTVLVALAHESHPGVVRTKQRLRDLYWWPHLDALVLSTIASCQPCQLNDKTATPHAAPLQPVPLPDWPWRILGLDIVGPFEIAKWDCKYAITLTDYYSKWPEVAFTPSVTTADVTAFLTTVFARHGLPECITTDHGPQFTSAAFTEFLKERNIKQTRSSVYHPAANGAVERFNRVLKESIQTAMQHSLPWKAAVTEFLQVFRATPHATTGVSPFEMLHGRKMQTKLDILPLPVTYATTDAKVRQRVHRQQSKMKIYTAAKRGARIPQFQEGDKVRIKNPLHVLKGHSKFCAPVDVRRQVGPSTYVLGDGKTWNASHLTLFPIPAKSETPAAETETPAAAAPSSSVELAPDSRVKRRPLWLKDYDP
ncbi:hypothetical protein SKAU_G00196500 [Synaphobranchus kaupii]|uniref:Gypsy retrotransposon integrase-like protein 1 n=1 Tax=Synaphobranchus kaupii TaxID=118154 RepID=A0A9Q1FEQ6_SYNKA|nr:hypothetical protein SKAU_G00196500 [Synaphobranchus kaupii]